MTRKYKISILLFILMLTLGVVLEHKLYGIGEVALRKNADEIFRYAVNEYFDDQYLELKFSCDYRFSKSESERNNCVITDANKKNVIDIVHKRNKNLIGTSFHEKMEHTILAKENSIVIDSLSLVWNKKLQDVGIVSKNAIRINFKLAKDTVRLVSGDSTLCIAKYKIADTYYAGLSNEIEIVAFIRYSWMTVIKHSYFNIMLISPFFLSFIILLFFILFYKQKVGEPHSSASGILDLVDTKTFSVSNMRYELNHFYVNDKKIHVRPQSASLLLFLLQKPGYYATKQEIIDYLWTAKISADSRLRRAISDLRHLLKEESVNLEVSTEGQGFRLIVSN